MNPSVLYQDDFMVVIDKPAGMVVNRAQSVKSETVQDWVEKQFSIFNFQFSHEDKEFKDRMGIVHRIDKETSGILLIAKNSLAFCQLQQQFKDRQIKKTYLALIHGNIPEKGEIHAPIDRLPWNREQFGVVPGGKESVTRFKKLSTISRQLSDGKKLQLSLCEVYPETGRTHQIRVHFKYLGYPLVGDYLYGGRKQSRDDREWAGRVMLHAWKITFVHPMPHIPLAFEAPIPDDMNSIINMTNITNVKSDKLMSKLLK